MKINKSDSNSPSELVVQNEWILRLYVTMQSFQSILACTDLKEICKLRMHGKYEIEVINLLRSPQLGHDHQIRPATKVVEELPEPFRKVIENLFINDSVLVGMDLVSSS